MGIIKIIVADDNDVMRNMIVDAISDCDRIQVVGQAHDGEEAISLILKEQPDMVLLDIIMPKLDGLDVMNKIRTTDGIKVPEFVIISAAGSESIVNTTLKQGASYYIMKPFNGEALVNKILAAFDRKDEVNKGGDAVQKLDNYVSGILRNLGVPIKMVGYKYLRDAIITSINTPDSLMAITKTIYPEVAIKHETSSGNVERNIRYVIEQTWQKITNPSIVEFAKQVFKDLDKKPTNTEFILACTEWVNYDLNE